MNEREGETGRSRFRFSLKVLSFLESGFLILKVFVFLSFIFFIWFIFLSSLQPFFFFFHFSNGFCDLGVFPPLPLFLNFATFNSATLTCSFIYILIYWWRSFFAVHILLICSLHCNEFYLLTFFCLLFEILKKNSRFHFTNWAFSKELFCFFFSFSVILINCFLLKSLTFIKLQYFTEERLSYRSSDTCWLIQTEKVFRIWLLFPKFLDCNI